MTKLQKLQLEQSEKREQVNALLGKPAEGEGALTDAERTELGKLTARLQAIEPELRAAMVAEQAAADEQETERRHGSNGDGEAGEVRALLEGVLLSRYLTAAAQRRSVDGREGELNAHLGLGAGQIPWEALEVRAVSEAPATLPVNQQPILSRVFANGDAQYLGIAQPMVPVGTASYPTLTQGVTAADVAKNTAISGSAVAAANWTVATVNPTRVSASYEWNAESAATFPGLESSLRGDLAAAMQSAIDKRIVTQLLGAGGLADPTNPTNAATAQDFVDVYAEYVDGRYATMADQVRLMVNAETYAYAFTKYLGTGDGQTDHHGAALALATGGGFRVSGHLPAAASDIAKSIAARGSGWAVAPVWQGVQTILDEVTGADEGKTTLTAVALVGFAMRRADEAKQVEWKLA